MGVTDSSGAAGWTLGRSHGDFTVQVSISFSSPSSVGGTLVPSIVQRRALRLREAKLLVQGLPGFQIWAVRIFNYPEKQISMLPTQFICNLNTVSL